MKRKFIPRLKTWKLRDPTAKEAFEAKFKVSGSPDESVGAGVDSQWSDLKSLFLSSTKEICSLTNNHHVKCQSWGVE